MGVDAHLAVMVVILIRTPHCFKMIEIEVHVYIVIFNQLNGKLFSAMGEAAKL